MESTNVHSNYKEEQQGNNPAPVFGQTIPTKNELEMPPKATGWGVSEKEVKNYEKNNEIVISEAGTSKVNEDGTLEKNDGTILTMKNNKNAFKNIMNSYGIRLKMEEELKELIQKDKENLEMGTR